MNKNKLLLCTMIAGTGLAAARILSASTRAVRPANYANSYRFIDEYIEGQMRRLHIPGASIAIVEGEQIVYRRGFGKARPDGKIPTSMTPFFIGSITKSITALAVMQLVETGKVELDAPVQRYLPWFRVADEAASERITVRQLLCQTSGLPLLSSEIGRSDFDDHPDATERYVRALSTEKLKFLPGTKWGYSNHNYNILGLIVQAASGEPYSDYIKGHIFKPLQMNHTYITKEEAKKNGLAVGYRHWFSLPFPAPNMPVPTGVLPSGQLISCAEDMAHYLIAHLNGGSYENSQVLSSAGIMEMHKGAKEVEMFGATSGSYGMGWFDVDLGSTKTYWHGGNTPDFSAFMALIPDQRKAIIVLFNADPYCLPPVIGEVGMGISSILAGQTPEPIKYDFLQWIFRLLPLIPLLQVVGVFGSIRQLRNQQSKVSLLPTRKGLQGNAITLPLALNFSLAGIIVYLRSSGLMPYFRLFNPDLAWTAQVCGALAIVSIFLHTQRYLRFFRRNPR